MIFKEISNNTFDGLVVREHSEYNHEKVYYYEDPGVSLKSLVAIHSTKHGPAIGGCRFKNYDNFLDGLNDVLRLSRGMTEKNIAADVPFGGGKAIIFANGINKSHDLLKSFANFLNLIKGEYISAEDIGITLEDIQFVGNFTDHVFNNVDPSSYTARGIFYSIKEVLEMHNIPLSEASVGIQGAGNVGFKLSTLLLKEGVKTYISDTDQQKLIIAEEGGCIISKDIFLEKMNVFAPCAVGGILDELNISKLSASFVIGGANNQLLNPSMDTLLRKKNIIYIPDAMINAGGVIGLTKDILNRNEDDVDHELRAIAERVCKLLERSLMLDKSPYELFMSEIIN